MKRSTSPLQGLGASYEQPIDRQPQQPQQTQQPLIPQWPVPPQPTAHLGYPIDNTYGTQYTGDYGVPYQTSPIDFMPTQTQLDPTMQLDSAYLPLGGQMDSMSLSWQTWQNDLIEYPPVANGLPDMALQQQTLADHSPTDTYLEVRSLTSCSSSDGWAGVDYHPFQSMDTFQDTQVGAISNPEQTLHGRTLSDSSYSDVEQQSQHSWSSFVDVPNAISSPGSDSFGEMEFYHVHNQEEERKPSRPMVVTPNIKSTGVTKTISPHRSPTSASRSSPPTRRQSRKITNPKPGKNMIRRPPQPPKPIPEPPSEKRIGKRKGPLRPDQRKQAGEIRKLGACLRCKFLKKTVSKRHFRS